MKRPNIQLVQASIKTEWPQVAALLALVLVFISHVTGLLEFGGSQFPGIRLQLSVLTGITNGAPPAVVVSPEFLVLFLTGIVLALLMPLLTPIAASALVAVAAMPSLYLGLNMPLRDPLIPMQYNLLVLLVLFGVNVLINYFLETRKKQQLITAFGRFMPPEIVERLSKEPELLDLEGVSKNMTVFFCDLINFTSYSEKLDPKQLVALLNEYFTLMTEILYKHGATIDKYIGDSIMAFWSAPVPQEDHHRRAVMAAFEMHHAIETKLARAFTERGLPSPAIGIGINSGIMNVGNMGSRYRLAYTVLGDAVNLGSRLETLTRLYQVPTIVGEETAINISDVVFRELDTVVVKGKTTKSRIYQPLCLQSELTDVLKAQIADHNLAIDFYYAGNMESALALFQQLHEQTGDPYYSYMLSLLDQTATSSPHSH